nr:hypothetical protein CFP56_11931 [Quercus suber]
MLTHVRLRPVLPQAAFPSTPFGFLGLHDSSVRRPTPLPAFTDHCTSALHCMRSMAADFKLIAGLLQWRAFLSRMIPNTDTATGIQQ